MYCQNTAEVYELKERGESFYDDSERSGKHREVMIMLMGYFILNLQSPFEAQDVTKKITCTFSSLKQYPVGTDILWVIFATI